MTDDEQANRLDRIVVYATIDDERFNLAELVERLNQLGLKIDSQALDRSLDRLELGFVLGRDDDGYYYYRVPLFCEMIRKDDPAVRLPIELRAYQ